MDYGPSFSVSTSAARDRLSAIITQVQDPRSTVILTRHGKPVAAVVSMAELKRIWKEEEIEDIVQNGRRPARFMFGRGLKAKTAHEAAEQVHQVQLDRLMEREILQSVGMEPIPGGELMTEVGEPRRTRRWWERFRRR
ncbi:type II toxin-antitoxin system Phd/YefM family antitoxin [Roseovarius sp. 2305UL8-3]|uniref:type II toxin-antitoxin system Phd/YefM family antitoxin n=1 Tax=Roseovarius conchicola TaxID=3121636 RepID=UPI00352840FF